MRLFGWLIFLGCATTLTAGDFTALGALKLLPKERAANLARIEGRDGTPAPDRWYLVVHDPEDENGVREFVVANGEVVAARPISQFAEKIQSADVIGYGAVKVDTEQLAKMARQYAQANNLSISKIDYELKKEGADAAPVWKVSCTDENDRRLGELVVTAGKGNIVSHDGFAVTPQAAAAEKKQTKFDVYADPAIARSEPSPTPDEEMRERRRRNRDEEDRGGSVGNAAKSFGRGIRRILPF